MFNVSKIRVAKIHIDSFRLCEELQIIPKRFEVIVNKSWSIGSRNDPSPFDADIFHIYSKKVSHRLKCDYFCTVGPVWLLDVSAMVIFMFSIQAFRPIELKLLSKQEVDLSYFPRSVFMRKTGEVVFVRHVIKEEGSLFYLYTLQQGSSLDKKKIKLRCNHLSWNIKMTFDFLFVQILWREYLASSCSECKNIKLVNLETLEMATAYSDDQPLGKMCKGRWHKIYVQIESGFVELDCSSTKFTKIRQIETGEDGRKYPSDMCYVPSPHKLIVAVNADMVDEGGWIQATSTDETNKTMWHLLNKEVDGRIITPQSIVYSSRHDALLVVDAYNSSIWVLNPATREVVQNIDVPELYCYYDTVKGFLRGSQLAINSNSIIKYFSVA